MKSKLTLIFMLLAGIIWSVSSIAQPVTFKADTVVTCPGPGVHVFVPITLQNFNGVAAFNLELNFDTNAVTFVNASQINQTLATNGMLIQSGSGYKWAIIYLPNATISIPDDTLCVLEFIYKQNWSSLTWVDSLCDFTDDTLATMSSLGLDGLISLTGPVVVTQPVTTSASPNTNAQFMVSGTNITAYQWQSSPDGVSYVDLSNTGFYSDVTTSTLLLTSVNPTIDGTYYRCKVTGPCGDQYSGGAKLLVISTTPIHTYAGQNVFCKGNILVPIKVTDLYNVRDFTLSVDINTPISIPTVLNNPTIQNVNPDLLGTFVVTATTNNILIEFTGDVSHIANFGSGTLFDLAFTANAGVSQFNWVVNQCEYLTPAGSPILVTFADNNFTVIPLPQMPIYINGPSNVCNDGGTYTYSTPANSTYISYIWELSPADAGVLTATANICNITYDPAFSGTATITVKGQNSCGTSNPNALYTILSLATPTTISTISDVCINAAPVTLNAGSPPGGSYSGLGIYNGIFYPDSVGVGTTEVVYTFTNPFNCSDSDTTTITVLSLPSVSFSVIPAAVCYNDAPFFLSGGSPAGGTYSGNGVNPGSGIFSPGFGLIGDQPIKYTVTGSNGCKNSATDDLHVDACLAIGNITDQLNFQVQPNPSTGQFEVSINNLKDDAVLSIYNDLGQQVYNENLNPATTGSIKIDLSNQPRGMYFLMLNSKGNILVDKLILK